MTPKEFYQSQPKDRIDAVCKDAGTTFENFKQIAVAGGACGKKLAERIAQSSGGEMSELEILYPERYQQDPNQAA